MRFCSYLLTLIALLDLRTQAATARQLAGTTALNGQITVGWIASPESLHLYQGQGTDWQATVIPVPDGQLIENAPLVLLPGTTEEAYQTRAITVTQTGRLVLITITQKPEHPVQVSTTWACNEGSLFPVRAGFTTVEDGGKTFLYAVNQQRQLVELDVAASAVNILEQRDSVVLPGSAVGTRENNGDEIFLVDRRGNLVCYVRDPIRRWRGPQLVGTGFLAGGDLVIWRRPDGAQEDYLAAVNARGELRLARHEPTGWRMDIAPGWLLPPGTPISVFHTPINIRLFGVTASGVLQEMHLLNTEWRQKRLAAGHLSHRPVYIPSKSLLAVSVDATGNLLAATNSEEIWTSSLTSPALLLNKEAADTPAQAMPLHGSVIAREWSPPEYQLIEFRLINSSDNDLILKVRDRRQPSASREILLAGGQHMILPLECERPRTLATQLKLPVTTPPAAETAAAEANPAAALKSVTTPTEPPLSSCSVKTESDGPFEIEVLRRGTGISYQDIRMHQFPRIRPSDPVLISLGRFFVTAADSEIRTADEDSQPTIDSGESAAGPIEVDVIQSAELRTLTRPTASAVP